MDTVSSRAKAIGLYARVAAVLTIPVGFAFSIGIFEHDYFNNAMLTLVATACLWMVLVVWKPPPGRYPHVYVFFALFVIGYFIKLYILGYMVTNEDVYFEFLDIYYDFERQVLKEHRYVGTTYEIATLGLVFATMSVGLLKVLDRHGFKPGGGAETHGLPELGIPGKLLSRLLLLTVVVFLSLLALQIHFGLNFASGDQRQTVVLPYRLAGIILALYKYLVPLLFVGILYAADGKHPKLFRWAVVWFVAYGVLAGMHSTSKAYLLTTIIVMALLWIMTGRLTRGRIITLIALVAFMVPFNVFLGVNRILRVIHHDVGVWDVAKLGFTVLFDRSAGLAYVNVFHSEATQRLTQYLAPLMRVNGADALMNVVAYRPQLDLSRTMYLLFDAPDPVNVDYATKVLGLTQQAGLAFSPSLMGYFYYVFASPIICGFGAMAFLLFWHGVFALVRRVGFRLHAVVSAILLMSLMHYVSEGTLESMPLNIALVLTVSFGLEMGVRFLSVRPGRMPVARSMPT